MSQFEKPGTHINNQNQNSNPFSAFADIISDAIKPVSDAAKSLLKEAYNENSETWKKEVGKLLRQELKDLDKDSLRQLGEQLEVVKDFLPSTGLLTEKETSTLIKVLKKPHLINKLRAKKILEKFLNNMDLMIEKILE